MANWLEISDDDLDEILEYQKIIGTETLQAAVMNAIRNAVDKENCSPTNTTTGDGRKPAPFPLGGAK